MTSIIQGAKRGAGNNKTRQQFSFEKNQSQTVKKKRHGNKRDQRNNEHEQ